MGRLQQIKSRLTATVSDLERRSFVFSVLLAAVRDFNQHHCTHLAAGIAYYAIFSLFPLLLGLIALASFLIQKPGVQEALITAASQVLPGSEQLVQRNIQQILIARGTIGIVATISLLWAAKAVFGAMTLSLNLAWGVPERRSFWELTAMQMALVLGAGFFFASSIALTYALAVVSSLPIPGFGSRLEDSFLGTLFTEPFILAIDFVAFSLLYRFLPCTRLSFRDVWPGALVAAILFEIAKNVYVFYTTDIANYRLIYGSLAAFIVLLVWAWISSAILLFGAEISADYDELRQRNIDSKR